MKTAVPTVIDSIGTLLVKPTFSPEALAS